MDQTPSKFWLDVVAAELEQRHPKGAITVSSGHSPSGNYHVGIMREFLIADALRRRLAENGRQASHLDFVDDFDILRKIPAGLSGMDDQLGKPLYLARDPEGQGDISYGQRYLDNLYRAVNAVGLKPEVMRAHQEYKSGKFTEAIELSLSKLEQVRAIINEVSGRQLPNEWAPVQLLDDEGCLNHWIYTGWDQNHQIVSYRTADGEEGELSYAEGGRVKLDWRLDWPARWWLYKVQAEPFGRDHATKGGSYDTGKRLVEEIFNYPAPYPVPYEFVMLAGQTKKLSKSAGNVLTPQDALEVMPPEILRYFMLRSRPAKALVFDSGPGLYALIDEYAGAEAAVAAGQAHPFADAYRVAAGDDRIISSVKFSHLVMLYQTARGDEAEVIKLLERTGYGQVALEERELIASELTYIAKWLKRYASEDVKFELQDKLPEVELSDQQKAFLSRLAEKLAELEELDGPTVHEAIYEAKDEVELDPAEAFASLYRVLLGKDSGPKAGWFLASLEPKWLARRLKLEA